VPTTAEHLEGMTDAGEFEILATRALRFLDDDCRAIAHLGTNAEGKTVPSPVDGFVLVPNRKPNRYVMTAFTTSADLKGKWLYDSAKGEAKTAEDGDLPKAAKLASALRAKDPEAEFYLYLCTNRRLSQDLMDKVYAAARLAQMSVEFLEQSRLRDFLDATADGQWLRQLHLEITAERLSVGLLRDLSTRSLAEYRSDAPFGGALRVVRTSACDVTTGLLREPSVSLVLLVGPSGAGKTVLAQSVFGEHLDESGFAIWVPGEVAEWAINLPDAVGQALRLLHARLDPDAGRTALQLASPDRPLWIVVDDVNRSAQPSRVLEKIIGWARPSSQARKTQNSFRILCPVWELHSSVVELKNRSCDWIRQQRVRSFLRKESIACLDEALRGSGLVLSPAKLNRYAEALRDDPILLGLFSEILLREKSQEPEAVANDVIGHYVKLTLEELAGRTGDWPGEYSDALDAVARALLLRKKLRPERRELQEWFAFPSKVPALLKEVITSGRICRSVRVEEEERVEFRHDRILEHFLAKAAGEMLRRPDDPPEALADPYFAPQIGIAVADGQISTSKLDWLLANNPIALVASLRSIRRLAGGAGEITSRVHSWLSNLENRGTAQWDYALYLLAETNSPYALSVTDGVSGGIPHLWEARLRNGDALAGAHALSVDFYPRVHYSWLESLIADAQENYGPRLVSALRELLPQEQARGSILHGALSLAGYLADPLLADTIVEAFEKAPESDQALECFLWAGLRCGTGKPEAVLGPMMEKLLAVDHTSTPASLSRRDSIEEALAFCGRHGFADSVLAYLTELGEKDEYRWSVASILRNVDHPIAVSFMVRTIAQREAQMEKGYFSPYAIQWRDQWRRNTESRRLSEVSLEALRALWKNPANPEWSQKYAFEVWAECTDDLEALREVGVEGGPFADISLRRRAVKGDSEVASALKTRIAKGEFRGYWLQFLHHVWRPDFEEMLDDLFTAAFSAGEERQNPWSNRNYELAHVLRDIPAEPAERLLLKHWSKLAGVPLFLQAALYLSTEKSRKKAAEALAAGSSDAFEHVGWFFGFNTSGLQDRLRLQHLESLKPYLVRVDAMTIREMAEWCFRNGFRSWAIENVKPVCAERLREPTKDDERNSSIIAHTRVRWFPTEEDLFAQFSAGEGLEGPQRLFHFERLFDHCIDAGETPSHFFGLLEVWVARAPSESRRATALAALQMRGGRADLERLRACFAKSNLHAHDDLIDQVTYLIRQRTLE
jgi:hypothetical protein